MENLENKLNQILSDPESMAQIMQVAQSLMGTQASTPAPDETPGAQSEIPQVLTMLMQQASHIDRKEEALLSAIQPYLRPDRREKMEKAMRLARLSRLAGFAMKNLDL